MRLSGDAAGALYPGARARPVRLTLHNPTGAKVYFTRVSVRVQSTGALGCRVRWFRTSGVAVPRNGVVVPPRSSVTLPAAGVAAPTVRMLDSGTNQNACRKATLKLRYSARAQSDAAASEGTTATHDRSSPAGRAVGDSAPLPFTGLELGLAVALAVLLLVAGAALRRSSATRGER